MFSGIIAEIGEVVSLEVDPASEIARLKIRAEAFARKEPRVRCGDSIAVSGVCLTVVSFSSDVALFDLATETRRLTTLGELSVGDRVNIEESLRMGDSLDGHMVQGHVDAVSSVVSLKKEDNTWRCTFSMNDVIRPLIAKKGSITVDGVSLTVADVSDEEFVVFLVPYTWSHTLFSEYTPGRKVNIETDCVARYLLQLASPYLAGAVTVGEQISLKDLGPDND
jgi:riboflavin synthase